MKRLPKLVNKEIGGVWNLRLGKHNTTYKAMEGQQGDGRGQKASHTKASEMLHLCLVLAPWSFVLAVQTDTTIILCQFEADFFRLL